MSMTEYIRDSRFQTHGYAYAYGDDAPKWVRTIDEIDNSFLTDWSQTVVIAQNVKFDGAILAWRYGIKPYAWFDTAALGRAVLGEKVAGYSLKTLAAYLGLPAKGELSCDGVRDPSPEQLSILGRYCENDVRLCQGIFKALYPQFPQSQLWHMDWTIRAFIDAQLTLNTALLEEGVKNEKERREKAIQLSGVDRKTLSSNKQFAAHLVGAGYDVATKRSPRTGEQIPAFGKSDEGIVSLPETLRNARLAAKSSLLETRGESLLAVGKTGAFPFDVGFSGAVQTHRYSGGSGAGGNPQNFTRGSFLRGAVRPPAGQSMVVGDFAAIELRILSWLAKEPKLINAIINELDLYCDFASRFYGRSISKADKIERQFGKCAILGLGYGMGAKKFAATVKAQLGIQLTEDQAQQVIDLYRETYFNVPRLWDMASQAIGFMADARVNCLQFAPFIKVRKNMLVLPSGLTLQYPNLRIGGVRFGHPEWVYDSASKKKSKDGVSRLYGGKLVENICQALAGELCKEAIEKLEDMGVSCAGQVHDEIIAIEKEDPHSAAVLMKYVMEQSPAWWREIKLSAEVGTGDSWLAAK